MCFLDLFVLYIGGDKKGHKKGWDKDVGNIPHAV